MNSFLTNLTVWNFVTFICLLLSIRFLLRASWCQCIRICKLYVEFGKLFLICIWFLHYSVRAVCYDFVRRYPGRLCDRARYNIFGSYDVLRFPRPRHRAGYRLWSYDVIWHLICYDDMMCVWYDVSGDCTEIWNLLELWCVKAPASGGDHVPIPYTWFDLHLYVRLPRRFALFTMLVCLFFLTPAVFVISVPSALHTQYFSRTDPRFFGGCVSCPQVQKLVWVVLQFRLLILLCWRAPLDPERTFGTYLLLYVCSVHLWVSGYGGALSRHMFICSVLFRGL